jgi:hypothetical protein
VSIGIEHCPFAQLAHGLATAGVAPQATMIASATKDAIANRIIKRPP